MNQEKKVSVAILFTNYTEKDFSWSWDGVRYDFPAGASRMMEDHLAHHFAKHLAVRELNRHDKPASKGNVDIYKEKALSSDQVIKAEDTASLNVEVMNYKGMKKAELVEAVKEKGLDIKTTAKKADLVAELEAFEGLKE